MVERIGRKEFLTELGANFKPGQHLSAIGPTGRGKSTVLGELLGYCREFHTAVVLTPKGPDPAFLAHGHATASWPPRRNFGETFQAIFNPVPDTDRDGMKIWRVQRQIKTNADWAELAGAYRKVLSAIPRRKEGEPNKLLVVIDESRFLCDRDIMNLATEVRNALILGRSKNASIINSFQAPRWVPREALDQISHALVWRNRDRDVAKRLAEISGAVDPKEFLAASSVLGFHEFIWVDGRADNWVIVNSK